ncbi:hypothetical protein Ahy_A08g039452 [Arachis hypogaea]|uniref:Uncharacterized protein n=1 Tax=Arachis hypogaea TaxID=3818 RepID=A0A445BWD1_ARAHY|nr:hypothetical protein Ahy_A08g039452 [Arachis hypogaea]
MASGIKFTDKDPLSVFIRPFMGLVDFYNTVLQKLGLHGMKWIEKLYYRILIFVVQNGVKYDSFVIGSDEVTSAGDMVASPSFATDLHCDEIVELGPNMNTLVMIMIFEVVGELDVVEDVLRDDDDVEPATIVDDSDDDIGIVGGRGERGKGISTPPPLLFATTVASSPLLLSSSVYTHTNGKKERAKGERKRREGIGTHSTPPLPPLPQLFPRNPPPLPQLSSSSDSQFTAVTPPPPHRRNPSSPTTAAVLPLAIRRSPALPRVLFFIFSFLHFNSKIKSWYNCHACRTYLNMSWTTYFGGQCGHEDDRAEEERDDDDDDNDMS